MCTHMHTDTCVHIYEYTLILIIDFDLTICLLLYNAVLSNLLRLFQVCSIPTGT